MLSSEVDGIAPSPTPHPQAFCPSYAKTCAFYRRGGFIKTAATWNGRSRRVSLIPVRPREGRLTEPTAATGLGGANWSSCPLLLPVLCAMLLGFARLCRRCRPGWPPKWRKTRVLPGTEAKSGERQTVCWRGLDSKFQFRATLGGLAGLRDPQSGQRRLLASEFVSTHCRREVDLPSERRMPSRLLSGCARGARLRLDGAKRHSDPQIVSL